MPLTHDIRFCTTSDGVRIAYETHGSGYPMVWVPGWISHLELDEFISARHTEYWSSRGVMVVRYDKRNTGLSDRGIPDTGLEARVRDFEAVVDALALERFAVNGISEGGPIAISYAATHPDRVSHLILFGTYANGAAFASAETTGPIASVVRAQWGLASSMFTDMLLPDATPEERRSFARLQREGVSADDAVGLIEAIKDIDVRDLLPSIAAKTVVIHGKRDRAIPYSQARELAAGIRGAKLVTLDSGHATTSDTDTNERMHEAIHELLADVLAAETEAAPERASGVCTVLFTDIVGHTEMMQRLGDERGREVLREHERITRDLLKQHAGAEVKTMGDGFMASFTSVTKAMDCAIALQRAFDARNEASAEPLHVRVGLNAGEPIDEDGDLFGSTVILASRIAAKAGPGEILVPEPLRHLLAGKTYEYADRGDTLLKGFEDAVRLHEVRWRP
jgi:class 3 adenylate cyclase